MNCLLQGILLLLFYAQFAEAKLLGTTITSTVVLETDSMCYKTFPLAKPCKGKPNLKDLFSKGRSLWSIEEGPIYGKDGSISVGSEEAMNSLVIKPSRQLKGETGEDGDGIMPQVSFNPAAYNRNPRFCCDYFYTSTSRHTMTLITKTITVKLLCKPSTYCLDACEKIPGFGGIKDLLNPAKFLDKLPSLPGKPAGGLRRRPAADYLEAYFPTTDAEDYYYDDDYEDIYAAIEYQKALAKKQRKAAMAAVGREAAESKQADMIALRRSDLRAAFDAELAAAGEDEELGAVVGADAVEEPRKLRRRPPLSRKDIEWVEIKSFIDE